MGNLIERIDDIYNEPIDIEEPIDINVEMGAVVSLVIHEDGDSSGWCGNREQLRKLIEALQEFESKLEQKKDDASNLPPMSNKVEGGGHFGLG